MHSFSLASLKLELAKHYDLPGRRHHEEKREKRLRLKFQRLRLAKSQRPEISSLWHP